MIPIHPSLVRFVQEFEEVSRRKGRYRNKIGHAELLFLENVWGPLFQFNFEGLTAEYPFVDAKGGERFVDFMYNRGNLRLMIEIDGFTTHAKHLSPSEFEDHLDRQNDLLLSGWLLIRFSARQVEQNPAHCQNKLQQALGSLWISTHGGLSSNDLHTWDIRKHAVIQLATRQEGWVRPVDVAKAFKLHLRTAQLWMKRFANEGSFIREGGAQRTTRYRLSQQSLWR